LTVPIDRPRKIICVGLNYRDHAEEAGFDAPSSPMLFAKWDNALIGPGDAILVPPGDDEKIDYEGELGVVIGEQAKNVPSSTALTIVQGYVCFNDVSDRTVQAAESQWTRSKSFDTFAPVGPLVPASAVPDPQILDITTTVNGNVVQRSNTAQMIFSVAELISFISRGMTLEPGDLIATGTPGGVGWAQKPPLYLQAGDEITVEIQSVGSLTNPVRAA
jgi:2,4-diketo-3-deoxy-L-fuconate hydrolase